MWLASSGPRGHRNIISCSRPSEDKFTIENRRRDEVPALQEIASEMSHRDPLLSNRSSEEYRGTAEECLDRAREASADEVRLAYLTLASAWLKEAMGEDGGAPDHLPLAPRL